MTQAITQTQNAIDERYGLDIKPETPEDYFTGLVPLGSIKPPDEYGGYIPPEDEINLILPRTSTANPLNIAVIEPTGQRKTMLIKNIVYFLNMNGYNNVIVQYKSRQWEFINKPFRGGYAYHQNMKPAGMKRKNYIPSYILEYAPVQDVKKQYTVFSPDIKTFRKDLDWKYMKASDVATATLSGMVMQGIHTIDKMMKFLRAEHGRKKLAAATLSSALRHLENMKNKEIFGYPNINLIKYWEEAITVILSFFGQFENIELNIFKLVEDMVNVGISERSTGDVSRKMLICDDGADYLKKQHMYSTLALENIQNISREYGMNSLFSIQDPTETKASIIAGATTKIIGQIENPGSLQGKIPSDAMDILVNRELYTDAESYIFEKLLIQGGKVTRFFQYDCIPYHQL